MMTLEEVRHRAISLGVVATFQTVGGGSTEQAWFAVGSQLLGHAGLLGPVRGEEEIWRQVGIRLMLIKPGQVLFCSREFGARTGVESEPNGRLVRFEIRSRIEVRQLGTKSFEVYRMNRRYQMGLDPIDVLQVLVSDTPLAGVAAASTLAAQFIEAYEQAELQENVPVSDQGVPGLVAELALSEGRQ